MALTVDEYSKLPEVIGFYDELIEGVRALAPIPKLPHTVVIENLEQLLSSQFRELRVLRESGWHFQSLDGIDNVPGPDLMVILPADYERSIRSGGYFEGKPSFVIEVISPSERRARRLQKIGLYLEMGVIVVEVDYTKRIVLIHTSDEDVPRVIREGRVEWPFTADMAEIFARLR